MPPREAQGHEADNLKGTWFRYAQYPRHQAPILPARLVPQQGQGRDVRETWRRRVGGMRI